MDKELELLTAQVDRLEEKIEELEAQFDAYRRKTTSQLQSMSNDIYDIDRKVTPR